MAGDVLITVLPNEVIENILECDNLSYKDVLNVGSTCSKLRSVITDNNKLWRTKFRQQWPGLVSLYERQQAHSWHEEFRARQTLGAAARSLVREMSPRFYRQTEISNSELADFGKLVERHRHGYQFVVDELMSCVCDSNPCDNLTEKYYTEKALRYIRQRKLRVDWAHYTALPSELQLLERGAELVAQWCQPLEEVNVVHALDELAEEVRTVLANECPTHPLLSASRDVVNHWRSQNISDNQWKPSEARQVLSAACRVIFGDLGFHGNNEMYYSAENSYVNKVLETRQGIPITLSVVFESVARRLGVRCEPVSFPAHFLLRWRESYAPTASPAPYFYIDVFNGGQFLTKRSCPRYSADSQCPMRGVSLGPATPVQVVERMANNLEVAGRQRTNMNGRGARLRSALELLNMVNPSDMNCVLHLARFYMLYSMEMEDLRETLQGMKDLTGRAREQANHIMQMLQGYERHLNDLNSTVVNVAEPKRRSPQVQFAVGMVMRHRQYHYTCVIFGWDPLCAASPDWIQQMGVENLSRKDQQPFYNVLVDDGSTRYAAQENLEVLAAPRWVDHLEVGRYFRALTRAHYEPNAEKNAEYPEDEAVRLRCVQADS